MAAAAAPRKPLSAYKAVERLRLLATIRQMLRIDISDLREDYFLKALLTHHREIAALLERLLQAKDPVQRRRIRQLVGPPEAIESALDALEDKVEDLEIATNPEVHAAIEQLIDEAKTPCPLGIYVLPYQVHQAQQEGGYTVTSPVLPELITEGERA